jgi:DNA-binding CsgD family transcriptional regulator
MTATAPAHETVCLSPRALKERFLPFDTLARRPTLWIGLTCLLAWIDLLFCFEGALRDQVTEAGGLVHDPLFLAATLTLAVVLVAGALPPARAQERDPRERTPREKALDLGAALVGCTASAGAALLAALLPASFWLLPALLGIVLGLCMARGLLAWGTALTRLDLRAALLVASAAACLRWLVVVGALYTSGGARIALVGALPLVSAAALEYDYARHAARRTVWRVDRHTDRTGRIPHKPRIPQEDAAAKAPAPRLPHGLIRLAAAAGIFLFVAQFMWCYFIKALDGRLDVGLFPAMFATVAAVVALVGLGCCLLMERQHAYRLELYYRAAFVFCLCGVAATGVAATVVEQAELFMAYALVYVGFSLLGPALWMLAMGYVCLCGVAARRALGLVLGGQYAGMFLGFLGAQLLVSSASPLAERITTPVVVLACVLAVALAYTTLFPERDLLELAPVLFGITRPSVEQRCRELAVGYGLTPREEQVFVLLAHGRDTGFICEELGIARNTVNVHRKAVYAKLGVHTQQELLDLVETE